MAFALDDTARDGLAGATAEIGLVVGAADTAIAAGSGDLPVLATPRMIALMEQAACAALQPWLARGLTSVGTLIEVSHTAPTGVGARVRARATVTAVEGSRVEFDVAAVEVRGTEEVPIGRGRHTRAVVDGARFASRISAPIPG